MQKKLKCLNKGFSLEITNRLVFDETPKKSADALVSEAKTKALGTVTEKSSVEEVKAAAVGEINKETDADLKAAALAKLEAAKKAYEQEIQAKIDLIKAQAKATAILGDFTANQDSDWQFENLDRLENAKKELGKFGAQAGDTIGLLDGKIGEVNSLAAKHYESTISKAAETVATTAQSASVDDIGKALSMISKLQENKLRKFLGANEGTNKQLSTDTNAQIKNLLDAIKTAKEAMKPEDKEKFEKEFGKTYEIAKSADYNFDSSRNSSEFGWKAGAEEYLAMSIAEGKAIEAQNSIPAQPQAGGTWRVDSKAGLNTPGWQNDDYKGIAAVYAQAFDDLAAARAKSANVKAGDSTLAKDLFNKAREGFLAVARAAAKAESDDIARKEKEKENKADEKQKENMDKYNTELDNLAKAYANITSPAVKGYVDDLLLKDLNAAKTYADNGDYASAKSNVKNCVNKINAAFEDFGMMVKAVKGALEGGISSLRDSGEYYDDNKAKRLNNHANDSRALSGLPDYLKKAADSLSFNGWFIYDSFEGPRSYNFSGKRGQIKVTESNGGKNYLDSNQSKKFPVGSKSVTADWDKISGKASFDVAPYKHKDPVKKKEEPKDKPNA